MSFYNIITGACVISFIIILPAFGQIIPRQLEIPIDISKPGKTPNIELKLQPNPKLPNDQFPPLKVKKFVFLGNTVISTKELDDIVNQFLNREITQVDLDKITDTITKLYINRGYINTGAVINYGDNSSFYSNAATIKIRIIEGRLGKINVSSFSGKTSKRLKNYIRERITVSNPLNSKILLNDLNRLKGNATVDELSVKLLNDPNNLVNRRNLDITVKPTKLFDLDLFVDNFRSFAAGKYEGGVDFTTKNSISWGDQFAISYSRSAGGNLLVSRYNFPLDPRTYLDFGYAYGSNTSVATPFNELDTVGTAQQFSVGVNRVLLSNYINGKSELTIRLGFKNQKTQEQILGFGFPVSQGADENGNTSTSLVNLTLDYEHIRRQQALFMRTSLNFGADVAAETDPLFHNGQYFIWDADAIYSHKLPMGLLFVSKLSTQLADRPVVGADLFSIGGVSSVRGFRVDSGLGKNGVHGSIETVIPVYKGKLGDLSLTPFVDAGYVWSDHIIANNDTTLVSTGLDIEYSFAKNITANLVWGYPLLQESRGSQNFQDSSVLFSIRLNLL